VSVIGNNVYLLFGKHEDDCGNVSCPALQRLDTASMALSHPHVEQGNGGRSTIPDDREGHTASVIGSRIFVFGGTWTDEDDNTIYMNDLHVLDVNTFTWTKPATSGDPPSEREGHTAANFQKKVFIFGGTWVDEEDNSIYLNDLHVLDTNGDSNIDARWSAPKTDGTPPIQREGHTASMVRDTMVIFGGAGLDKENASVNLADLYMLNTTTMVWSQPEERRYHTATVIHSSIYIFGGQYYDPGADLHFECDNNLSAFDVETMTWSKVAVDSSLPLRRACHAAGLVGRDLFLVGGRYWDVAEDDYIFLNDIQVLNTTPSSTLSTDWSRYFNNEQLSDVTLIVADCRFHAHRVVLAARCNYFRCMLCASRAECCAVVSFDQHTPGVAARLECGKRVRLRSRSQMWRSTCFASSSNTSTRTQTISPRTSRCGSFLRLIVLGLTV